MACVSTDTLSHYRIDGGEPAYGSVCYERLMHGLTAVAFHLDGYIGLACQLSVGLAQGRDEQVVDVRVVGMTGSSEQLTEGFSAQADIQCLTLSAFGRHVCKRQMLQLFLNLLPVGLLPHEQPVVAVGSKKMRVVCEGVRLGRQLYRLSLKQLSVCGVEVFGDDAPGDAVAADMVTGQQENVPVADMAQGCLEHRAVLQVDDVQLIGFAEAY